MKQTTNFLCNLCRWRRSYLKYPIKSGDIMTPHERRLRILADALLIREPNEVIRALRRRDVVYFGPGGVLLFTTAADWSDEQLVKAAVELFVPGGAIEPTRRPAKSRLEAAANSDFSHTSERQISDK